MKTVNESGNAGAFAIACIERSDRLPLLLWRQAKADRLMCIQIMAGVRARSVSVDVIHGRCRKLESWTCAVEVIGGACSLRQEMQLRCWTPSCRQEIVAVVKEVGTLSSACKPHVKTGVT